MCMCMCLLPLHLKDFFKCDLFQNYLAYPFRIGAHLSIAGSLLGKGLITFEHECRLALDCTWVTNL